MSAPTVRRAGPQVVRPSRPGSVVRSAWPLRRGWTGPVLAVPVLAAASAVVDVVTRLGGAR